MRFLITKYYDAEDGARTHTARKGHWILNPTRLPIPPLRQWGV